MSSTESRSSERPALTDPMMAYRGLARAEDVVQMQVWLREFTYRPDSRMEIRADYGEPWLFVEVKVEDTYHPGNTIRVGHRRRMMPYAWADKAAFTHWLAKELQAIEVHESQEWFKWADTGKPVFDPHADDGGRRPTA